MVPCGRTSGAAGTPVRPQGGPTGATPLTRLATDGLLGDWRSLDFNIAALLDDVALVKERHQYIRRRIESNAEPGDAAVGEVR